MKRFLKLTNIIINTNKIVSITISPSKYTIHIDNHYFNGWFLFGGGFIDSSQSILTICNIDEPTDYQIVKSWINQKE